ncbi:Fe(3+) dicitrate transport protein [Marinobacter daqiaonensis]|uniref:Fe(3+) dicitrate transport protein n=1 Tax=Marinobacter daqiaonensis TaxID=650891 RepID=A0A1I6IF22_9GAMM|nr:TonB-dependent receptor [Marinobacter daqiaonensis]SFR65271.1 Fe(3+) dicitrate transport protein [Marinobacter daqiaonensis]
MAVLPMNSKMLLAVLVFAPVSALAEGDVPPPKMLKGISVVGDSSEEWYTTAGSAHRVEEATLEQDEYDNINRVLNDVPGVYIRGEEGYGLRPNIGLRGTTTERSQKVTLMMDGVVMAPAVYSAPAAYFFPQITRMVGVEVVKGPAAIEHGPATVGGAINLITRPIPAMSGGGLDVAAGDNDYGKVHGYYGQSNSRGGFLIEGVQTRTDGFKELDSGGDTGFKKSDVMVKGRLNSDPAANVYHQLDLTLNVATEISDETYLGLTDDDFAEDPYRRYAASRNARYEWDYWQTHLKYRIEFSDELAVITEGYYQDFQRDWNKLGRFNSGRTISEILANPDAGLNADFMAVLRGDKDSETDQETLLIGNNGRTFFSRGVQSRVEWLTELGETRHELTAGLRLHQDQVERNHTEQGFLMRSGDLQQDGKGMTTTLRQRERADALAFFIKDEVRYGKLKVIPGIRLEMVDYESENLRTGEKRENDNLIWLPGLGIHYQLTDTLGVLAGAHRGYVPTGPGVDDSIEPEKSTNYEAGFRFASADTYGELIGFFTDYSNLKGVCTFSSGCLEATGEAFNGGEVDIYGIEAVIRHQWNPTGDWRIPAGITYTYTRSEFKSDFSSDFPLWGEEVSAGDELPYMPRHKGSVSLGLGHGPWDVNLSANYVGEQLEQAGSGGPLEGARLDDYTVMDVSGRYHWQKVHQVYLRVENLLDETYMLSRRPLGARPGIDRTMIVGYKMQF